ncbi:hypothetical protein O181_091182 [Austropuccinia psidii MF-1]|uniref:Chromo domain-containing protein n=1 Tax=Austropuccinia psidii MF-1 TaxID=1389203 RepID=A0A9Q3P8D8_9BASI|nr:hypothetical protein [Austropuccinia psidii MF-1]
MLADHLKKNLLSIHTTARDFNYMWKKACDTAARCIDEAKEYSKQRYEKTHKEPDFREGDQVLLCALNFNNPRVLNKMRYSFVGPFTIIRFIVFPVSLVKPYHQTGEDEFPSRNKIHTPQNILKAEDSIGPVKKIMKASKIRLNGKDDRQYLVRFKYPTADRDKWLAEDSIPDGYLHLRIFRASRRA